MTLLAVNKGKTMINIEYIKKRLSDLESGVPTQDTRECLYRDVLAAIASSAQPQQELAKAALGDA